MTKLVRTLDSVVTTRIIQLFAVISLILSLTVGVRQYQLSDCLADYAERQSISTAGRAESAGDDRQAVREAFQGLRDALNGDVTQMRGRLNQVMDRYLQRTAQAEQQRKANPVPPPPSRFCG